MTGLAVVSASAFPTDCPFFGDNTAPSNLLHAARINGANNNHDVSGNDYNHVNVGDVGYTSQGVNNGVGGNGYIQTNLSTHLANSFLLYATFKLSLNGEASYSTWVAGNYVDQTVGGWGLYIRSEADPDNAGKLRIIARASMTRKRVSDGVFSFSSADLVLLSNLTSLPNSTDWFVLSMGFDLASRVLRVRNVLTGAIAVRATTDAEWLLQTYDGSQRNAAPLAIPNHRLMAAASVLDSANGVTLAECFYWNRLLTDTEIAEQLSYSRKFMLNLRGVTLP